MMGATAAVAAGSQAGMSIASSYEQSLNIRQQAAFQKQQADMNAQIGDVQAKDALTRGDFAANQSAAKTRRLEASQRVAAAGSGIDGGSGSAALIMGDTDTLGALDELTIRNNAWKEAWGFKQQAIQSTASGQFAQLAGRNQANNTLLTGGMQAIGYGGQAAYYYQGGARPGTSTTGASGIK